MNKKTLLGLVAILAAFTAGTMFSSPIASTLVGDSVTYKGVICACKNTNGICYEGMQGAYCNHNVVTNAGKNAIKQYLGVAAGGNFTFLAVGNGTAPAAGDTTLNLEAAGSLARAAGTYYSNAGNGNWSLVKSWTVSASFMSINSTAIFNQSATGTMLCGGTFTSVNLENADQLTINYTLAVT
ncbi:MAG: hypothetical protein NT129_05020 [Candidatus Aenigmarchaeota archaeon]|nr:hypothetical protein [Candidatus Aenigmarchaeota archaeon]